jgi:FlaA1/EpsC-like NDP-sugar epimerase
VTARAVTRNVISAVVSSWRRGVLAAAVDGGCWLLAATTAWWLERDLGRSDVSALLWLTAIALPVLWVLGALTQTYSGRYPTGSAEDARNLAVVLLAVASVPLAAVLTGLLPGVAASVPLTAALLALALSVGVRLTVRRWAELLAMPDRASARGVIVYGAGARGRRLVAAMRAAGPGGDLPAAFIDDDPHLRRGRVAGVPVLGTGSELAAVVATTGAELLVIASATVPTAQVREVASAATGLGLDVRVLPPVSESLRPWSVSGQSDRPATGDRRRTRAGGLRDVDVAELLCRRPVDIDVASIAGCLTGRRVLVTGAGGSIGSELCRRIATFGPAELVMLDRDESALHAVQLSIDGASRLDAPNLVLADIRDEQALRTVFSACRPDVVFHAAALKHLPMLQRFPHEAWQTNVLGTQHVLDAAVAAGVRTLVNISSDKAADPTSVLGRSKRIGERLVAAAAQADRRYLSVRFGNVLGSRGSVLTTFAEQLDAGGPLTVNHPEVTRFFMLISEAVQLVVQAAAIGRPGEVLVLDMGSAVRITDLARLMMTVSGRSARIVFTGLYDGEKLHEDLFGDGERDHRPVHPAIAHIPVPRLDPVAVRECGRRLGAGHAMTALLTDPPADPFTDPPDDSTAGSSVHAAALPAVGPAPVDVVPVGASGGHRGVPR